MSTNNIINAPHSPISSDVSGSGAERDVFFASLNNIFGAVSKVSNDDRAMQGRLVLLLDNRFKSAIIKEVTIARWLHEETNNVNVEIWKRAFYAYCLAIFLQGKSFFQKKDHADLVDTIYSVFGVDTKESFTEDLGKMIKGAPSALWLYLLRGTILWKHIELRRFWSESLGKFEDLQGMDGNKRRWHQACVDIEKAFPMRNDHPLCVTFVEGCEFSDRDTKPGSAYFPTTSCLRWKEKSESGC